MRSVQSFLTQILMVLESVNKKNKNLNQYVKTLNEMQKNLKVEIDQDNEYKLQTIIDLRDLIFHILLNCQLSQDKHKTLTDLNREVRSELRDELRSTCNNATVVESQRKGIAKTSETIGKLSTERDTAIKEAKKAKDSLNETMKDLNDVRIKARDTEAQLNQTLADLNDTRARLDQTELLYRSIIQQRVDSTSENPSLLSDARMLSSLDQSFEISTTKESSDIAFDELSNFQTAYSKEVTQCFLKHINKNKQSSKPDLGLIQLLQKALANFLTTTHQLQKDFVKNYFLVKQYEKLDIFKEIKKIQDNKSLSSSKLPRRVNFESYVKAAQSIFTLGLYYLEPMSNDRVKEKLTKSNEAAMRQLEKLRKKETSATNTNQDSCSLGRVSPSTNNGASFFENGTPKRTASVADDDAVTPGTHAAKRLEQVALSSPKSSSK